MHKLEVAEAAYIAGIVDGEGCIGINYSGGATRSSRGTAIVSIGQRNKQLLDWIQKITGIGGISASKTPGGKPTWTLTYYSKNALDLLEEIEGFLIVKADQAGFILERFGR